VILLDLNLAAGASRVNTANVAGQRRNLKSNWQRVSAKLDATAEILADARRCWGRGAL